MVTVADREFWLVRGETVNVTVPLPVIVVLGLKLSQDELSVAPQVQPLVVVTGIFTVPPAAVNAVLKLGTL